jgi:hypothetical protein
MGVVLSHEQKFMIGIVPAAFLALVTAGSVSVYGNPDPVLFAISIGFLCILILVSVTFFLKRQSL